MSWIEVKVDGNDVSADAMLKIATNTIKILKQIEKQMAKEKGIKPSVLWRIDMQSGLTYGLIAIRGELPRNGNDDLLESTWAEAQRRMEAKES